MIKVLLIDDEQAFTAATKRNLELGGEYEVESVNESNEALRVARDFRPDIVILDIVMPGADGGDVKNQLQADAHLKNVPIIFLSALVSDSDTPAGSVVESGGDVMVAKPVSADVLKQAIEQRLQGVL